ncbi:DUF6090 family protein [Flagellimonas zhangzhouensis]|uniref:Uncharacterized protein n=1 Tax=Flagellimonas zhangzhouensis TaxID=1073328 RepID=A0A1H2VY03_9FLAO|nr:DUF6090 family protein [Allomuricauda zhangzhouensis]SDQ04927.1 hypothetical protein SAMN05216294_0018 [Allomuricauda zhangzhouensis]SDW73203.1 hypothetical protein SAMN04487892_2274 [Allomuricauda zhangzhouensis]
MIKFFGKIRKTLVSEGKTVKYLKYAIGEIILVVIGILIALQVNNWNIDRQTRNKEQTYLKEIRNNLQQDSIRLQVVLDFNENKVKIVDEMLQIFVDTLTNEERFRIFNKNANDFTFYDVFDPVRIAFNNMLSAESIDLIENGELKAALSEYYNFDYLGGVQNRIMVLNRRVVDDSYPKLFTKEFVSNALGFSSKIPTVSEMDIASDVKLMTDLFGIKMIINNQNQLIIDTQKQNQDLITLLNSELNR